MSPWLTAAAWLAAPPIAGWLYQRWGQWRDRRRFPPPGALVPAGGANLHLWRLGRSGPSVLLESGIAASCLNWRLVHEVLAAHACVYAYDRAGFGWSPAVPRPRTIATLVAETNALLEAARVPLPVLLVGHSFGGLLVQHFAARFPEKVAGIVLVDPLEPAEWHPLQSGQAFKLRKGVQLSRRGAWLAELGVVRAALSLLLSGSRRLPQFISKAASGRGSVVPDRIVGQLRRLPPQWWPVIAAHWCQARSFRTMAEYLERLPANCAVPLDPSPLRHLPLTVISAENNPAPVLEAHIRTASLSSRGRHTTAKGCGHWIHLENPQIVIDEVRWMLRQ